MNGNTQLVNVPAEQADQTDAFIRRLMADEERLAEITCVGDGSLWGDHLREMLIHNRRSNSAVGIAFQKRM